MQRVTTKDNLVVGAKIIVCRPDRADQNAYGTVTAIENNQVVFQDPFTKQVHTWTLGDMGVEPYAENRYNPFWGTYLIEDRAEATQAHWASVRRHVHQDLDAGRLEQNGALTLLGF